MASVRAWRPRQVAGSSNNVAQRAALASRRKLSLRSYPTNDEEKTTPSGDASDKRFRRADRLADAGAYARVFAKAQRSRDELFTVLFRPSKLARARLGLAIARKHCKPAAGRNRIKRVVRESFRHHKQGLSGLDVVVMNTRATHTAGNRALYRSLERHWRRCSRGLQRRKADG